MLVLQAKKKSICENASNLLARGKKVMQSRASLQSKHNEALIQQAFFEKSMDKFERCFFEKLKLKFRNEFRV